jgi:hypothetical protein
MHRRAGVALSRSVDERAAVVPVAPARGGERVEHADELVARLSPGRTGGRTELAEPQLVDVVQVREYEVVLSWEVLVQRGLGHAGLGNHRVDADAAGPMRVEQAECRVEDAGAGGLSRAGHQVHLRRMCAA